MNRSLVLLVALAPAVCSAATRADSQPSAHRLVYDAESGKLLHIEPGEDPRPVAETEVLKAGTPLLLSVDKARCSKVYRWLVTGHDLPDVEPGFRGFEEAGGLLADLGIAPAPKGELGVAAGVLPLEVTVAQSYSRLLTIEGTQDARIGLDRDFAALESEIEDLEGQVTRYQEFSDGLSGEFQKRITELEKLDRAEGSKEFSDALALLEKRISEFEEDKAGKYKELLGGLTRESEEWMGEFGDPDRVSALTCEALSERQGKIERIHRKFGALRRKVQGHELASFPARFEQKEASHAASMRELERRRMTLQAALEAVKLQDSGRLPSVLPDVFSGTGSREAFLETLKRLRQEYGELVDAGYLQEIAEANARRQRTSADSGLRAQWLALETLVQGLTERLEEARRCLDDSRSLVNNQVKTLRAAAEEGNKSLGDAYARLAILREETRARRDPGPLEFTTSNRVAEIELERRERYAPSAFKVEAAVSLEAGAADSLRDPVSQPAFEPVGYSVTYEFHKLSQFAYGIGPLLTGLGNDEFGVRQAARLDAQGMTVVDASGAPILDPVVTRTGGDSNDLDYGLFVTYYLSPYDASSGADTTRPLGLALGFSLDEPRDNLFMGLSYQPTLGVQLMLGGHYGRANALQDNVFEGDILPAGATEAPTRREWMLEPFLGIVLEVKAFKRLITPAG